MIDIVPAEMSPIERHKKLVSDTKTYKTRLFIFVFIFVLLIMVSLLVFVPSLFFKNESEVPVLLLPESQDDIEKEELVFVRGNEIKFNKPEDFVIDSKENDTIEPIPSFIKNPYENDQILGKPN